MKKITPILLALVAFASVNLYAQKFPGLALTPPMGWNSWNKFAGNINEDLIRQTADAMATNGMLAAGYNYIVVDVTPGKDSKFTLKRFRPNSATPFEEVQLFADSK